MDNETLKNIRKNIYGEKLLFANKRIYTKQEKLTILNSIRRGLEENPINYYYLHYGYFKKMVDMCGSRYFDDDDFVNQLILYYAECDKRKLTYKEKEDYSNWDCYHTHNVFGTPSSESFSTFIKKRLISVYEIKSFFAFNIPVEDRLHDLNFTLTNNYLLFFYPNLYDELSINKLNEFVQCDLSCHEFENARDYHDIKVARKKLSNILKNR